MIYHIESLPKSLIIIIDMMLMMMMLTRCRGGDACALRRRAVPSFAVYARQRQRAGEDMLGGAMEGGKRAFVGELHQSRGRCGRSRTARHQADWHLLAPRTSDLADCLAGVRHLHVVGVAE